jgi:hypothetical protein
VTQAQGDILETPTGFAVTGSPPYRLPVQISAQLLIALFDTEPGDQFFIGELARDIPISEKIRMRRAAERHQGVAYERWAFHAVRWASIVHYDNKWHLEDFTRVYDCVIATGWADRIIVTTVDVRLVTTPRGLFSFDEFAWQYGETLDHYLTKQKVEQAMRFDDVLTHAFAPLIKRRVSLMNTADQTVARQTLVGLSSQDPKDWQIPAGFEYLSAE